MERTAEISPCERFRYRLGRRWAKTGQALVFIMLNPSTADAYKDDKTITRCIGFAKDHGFCAIQVVNLYAYRATKPHDLRAAGFPIGDENNRHIVEVCTDTIAGAVCLAWGNNAANLPRTTEVLSLLRIHRVQPMVLATSQLGIPRHPLMLPRDTRLKPFIEGLIKY
jgi:hypothetical protein